MKVIDPLVRSPPSPTFLLSPSHLKVPLRITLASHHRLRTTTAQPLIPTPPSSSLCLHFLCCFMGGSRPCISNSCAWGGAFAQSIIVLQHDTQIPPSTVIPFSVSCGFFVGFSACYIPLLSYISLVHTIPAVIYKLTYPVILTFCTCI